MIDAEIGFLAFYLLLLTAVAYTWLTRAQRDPGRHRIPGITDDDSCPYPPLSDFPDTGDYGPRKRLATTGELRALAYEGDLETINSEVAAWKAILKLDEWTTAA